MIKRIILPGVLSLFLSVPVLAQSPATGSYDELDIAYNPATKIVTGYYESSTGYDESTGNARFSCTFYLEGKLEGNRAKISTCYPPEPGMDVIEGEFKLEGNKTVSVHLKEEHGGCWNVEHFADEKAASFTLDQARPQVEIRYVISSKAAFHNQPSEGQARKAFIVKGDIVRITRFENGFAHCTYKGAKSTTQGWISTTDLNTPHS